MFRDLIGPMLKTGLLCLLFSACSSGTTSEDLPETNDDSPVSETPEETPAETPEETNFYYGADLSYVNEMEDCGATYYNADAQAEDSYQIFADAGANLVRVRLWHSPEWTSYSNFQDVKKVLVGLKRLTCRSCWTFIILIPGQILPDRKSLQPGRQ